MWKVHDGRIDSDDTVMGTFEDWDGASALEMVRDFPEHMWLEFDPPDDTLKQAVYDVLEGNMTALDIYVRGSFISEGVFISDVIEALEGLWNEGRITLEESAQPLMSVYTRNWS